jgi:DNA processing protein
MCRMIHYRNWLALERAQGIGSAALKEIFDTVSALSISIEDVFGCTEDELRGEFTFSEAVFKGIIEAKSSIDKIEDDYLNLVEAGIRVTLFFEKDYPSLIKERLKNSAPSVLYSIGDLALALTPCAAVLGHSGTSEKGEQIAWNTAKEFARHITTTVSGLSKGAGVAAHLSALTHGGNTIGVLPCGFFSFELSQKLAPLFDPHRFLLLSPFYPTEEYNQFNAMSRNRLICALSRAVFIVESKKDGGSFDAAKSAVKLQIPLFTAQYAEYPASAEGNPVIIQELKAHPVRGRKEGAAVVPNLDGLLAAVKFPK